MKYNWENIDNIVEETHEEGCREWQIDYSEKTGMYRVSEFLNNHFQNEIIFEENVNAYCPICNEKRWIPDIKGYCCKCGHHLNRGE